MKHTHDSRSKGHGPSRPHSQSDPPKPADSSPAPRGGRFNESRPSSGPRSGGRFSDSRTTSAPRGGRSNDNRPSPAPREAGRFNDSRRPVRERHEAPDAPHQQFEDEQTLIVFGRNAVREAIKAGRSINRVLVVPEQDGSLREILNLARDNKLIISEVPRKKLDELSMPYGHGERPASHQGIVALIPGIEYSSLEDILAFAASRGEKPFIILLDGIEDPHNLGSIIRSADCAGAHGVVIPKRRSSPVTAAAIKASAGAAAHVKIAKVTNLTAAIKELKRQDIWVIGADAAGRPMDGVNLKGPAALVIGSEGSGISRLVKEQCDALAAIELRGKLGSLSAPVAAAILMFEKIRQDKQ